MPDTYGQATPASSGILSGVVSKGYIVFLIKVIYQVIGIDVFAATGIQTVLLLFGIGGMIAGSVSAIFARRLTTMIAFSSRRPRSATSIWAWAWGPRPPWRRCCSRSCPTP